MDKKYQKFMKRCIALAKKANGKNMPNPFVGAVVYDEEKDLIISEGFHEQFGKSHAEVNAINNASGNTKGKTLVVNLEPCSHFGKTPPCADLIIKSGFKKVVVGMLDPNPKVSGRGAEKLKKAGIEVIVGVLEDECKELNKVFIKNILSSKPYIMLKTATTLDGKIATETGKSKWITNELSRNYVQKLRSSYIAIMTGSGTILADNPRLNVRLKNKKSPIRIVFDPNNKLNFNYNVFNDDGIKVIWVNNSNVKPPKHVEKIPFTTFDDLFKKLYEMKIYSIMVEAGSGLNSALIKEADEINQFISAKIFGSGKSFIEGLKTDEVEDCIKLKNIKIKRFEDNFLINGKIIK